MKSIFFQRGRTGELGRGRSTRMEAKRKRRKGSEPGSRIAVSYIQDNQESGNVSMRLGTNRAARVWDEEARDRDSSQHTNPNPRAQNFACRPPTDPSVGRRWRCQ